MSYLIKDTTKDERIKLVENALAIAASDDNLPTEDTIEMIKKYIDGEMELDTIKENIINKYKKLGE